MEYKIADAKVTAKYFSQSLKEAVENYRPPFTRLNIKLNPEKLGDVDVSLVQRGNNLHINVSSNPVAINILSMNSVELKNQLSSVGLGDATMNFSGGNNREEANKKNKVKEILDDFQDGISLELIVPRYA